MSGPRNVHKQALRFKDGSRYRGQVLASDGEGDQMQPHGFGQMVTKEGFIMTGRFLNGKAKQIVIQDPQSNLFYGNWSDRGKRHGRGVFVGTDGRQIVETYDEGKCIKRVRKRKPSARSIHWESALAVQHHLKGESPVARTGHSCVLALDGGAMLVFGGMDAEGATLNDCHVLDIFSRTWFEMETLGDTPPEMFGHTATMVGQKMVVIGGQTGITASSNVYVLDTVSGEWSLQRTSGVTLTLAGHTAALVKDRIICLSGEHVFSLNIETWRWTKDDPDISCFRLQPRSLIGQSCCLVGDSDLYFYGGKHSITNKNGKTFQRCTNTLRILHTDTMKWELPSLQGPALDTKSTGDYSGLQMAKGGWNCPRADHASVVVGQQMYIIGGWTSRTPTLNVVDCSFLNDVQVLDIPSFTWRDTTKTNNDRYMFPRGGHSALLIGQSPTSSPRDRLEVWLWGGENHAEDGLDSMGVLRTCLSPS